MYLNLILKLSKDLLLFECIPEFIIEDIELQKYVVYYFLSFDNESNDAYGMKTFRDFSEDSIIKRRSIPSHNINHCITPVLHFFKWHLLNFTDALLHKESNDNEHFEISKAL